VTPERNEVRQNITEGNLVIIEQAGPYFTKKVMLEKNSGNDTNSKAEPSSVISLNLNDKPAQFNGQLQNMLDNESPDK
jgi:hypothetical protein